MLMADGGDEGKDRQRRGEMHHTCKCINYAEQSKLSVQPKVSAQQRTSPREESSCIQATF